MSSQEIRTEDEPETWENTRFHTSSLIFYMHIDFDQYLKYSYIQWYYRQILSPFLNSLFISRSMSISFTCKATIITRFGAMWFSVEQQQSIMLALLHIRQSIIYPCSAHNRQSTLEAHGHPKVKAQNFIKKPEVSDLLGPVVLYLKGPIAEVIACSKPKIKVWIWFPASRAWWTGSNKPIQWPPFSVLFSY